MIIQNVLPQKVANVSVNRIQKPVVSFAASIQDSFEKRPDHTVLIKDLLENTNPKDWKTPKFLRSHNADASKYLDHPEYGKIKVEILRRNEAIERGFNGYSPDYHQAVINFKDLKIEVRSSVLESDTFKLALKVTDIGDKLIKPLGPPPGAE